MINRLNFKSIVRGTSHIRRPHMYATKKLIKLSLRAIASKIAPYIKTTLMNQNIVENETELF